MKYKDLAMLWRKEMDPESGHRKLLYDDAVAEAKVRNDFNL